MQDVILITARGLAIFCNLIRCPTAPQPRLDHSVKQRAQANRFPPTIAHDFRIGIAVQKGQSKQAFKEHLRRKQRMWIEMHQIMRGMIGQDFTALRCPLLDHTHRQSAQSARQKGDTPKHSGQLHRGFPRDSIIAQKAEDVPPFLDTGRGLQVHRPALRLRRSSDRRLIAGRFRSLWP